MSRNFVLLAAFILSTVSCITSLVSAQSTVTGKNARLAELKKRREREGELRFDAREDERWIGRDIQSRYADLISKYRIIPIKFGQEFSKSLDQEVREFRKSFSAAPWRKTETQYWKSGKHGFVGFLSNVDLANDKATLVNGFKNKPVSLPISALDEIHIQPIREAKTAIINLETRLQILAKKIDLEQEAMALKLQSVEFVNDLNRISRLDFVKQQLSNNPDVITGLIDDKFKISPEKHLGVTIRLAGLITRVSKDPANPDRFVADIETAATYIRGDGKVESGLKFSLSKKLAEQIVSHDSYNTREDKWLPPHLVFFHIQEESVGNYAARIYQIRHFHRDFGKADAARLIGQDLLGNLSELEIARPARDFVPLTSNGRDSTNLTFSIDLNANSPRPASTKNAIRVAEQDVIYWGPKSLSRPAEIVYHFELDGRLKSVKQFGFGISAWNKNTESAFDPSSFAELHVSKDKISWERVGLTRSNQPVENPDLEKISKLLFGATEIFVRAKLGTTVMHPTVKYSQFLRSSKSSQPKMIIEVDLSSF